MKLIHNTGTDRVIDLIRQHLKRGSQLGCVTPTFSLFAFAELIESLSTLEKVQLILPAEDGALEFLGSDGDRAARNRLQTRWLALRCAQWVSDKVELRRALGNVPQGAAVLSNAKAKPEQVVLGSFAFSTDGLGLTPGNPLSLIQASESSEEATQLAHWFDNQWDALRSQPNTRAALIQSLQSVGEQRDPITVYSLMLHHVFRDSGDEMANPRDRLHFAALAKKWKVAEPSPSNDAAASLASMAAAASAASARANAVVAAILSVLRNTSRLDLMPAFAVLTSYADALAEDERLPIYEDVTVFRQEWDQYLRSDSSSQTIAGFMSSKALGATQKASREGVALLTVHSSKGLEFDVVFVAGMAEGSFPDYRSTAGRELLEERRNAFVAFTRSKRLLYLTYPRTRMMPWGDRRGQSPSRFLKEAGLVL